MKALVYRGKGKIQLENAPKPRPLAGEVLLKVRSVGICGTDLHIVNGGTDVKPGTIIGHEFSGDIVALGKNVQGFKVGQRAVAEHVATCAQCYYCLRGKPNLCLKARIIGMHRPGALAEYVALPASLVYVVPKSISYDEAALIEPLTIALYATSQAGFLLEKKVAVVGQGPIGILLDQVLTAAGAHVTGIDTQTNRLVFAQKQGWVKNVLNPSAKDFKEQFNKIASIGVDASFEAVGKDVTAEMCIDITRRDGDIFLLGVFEKPATLDVMRFIKKELNLFGSWTCAFSFPAAIDMVAERKVSLKPLITHTYKAEDGAKAFAEAASYTGNRMKTIIRF